jgi:hypothetical protein
LDIARQGFQFSDEIVVNVTQSAIVCIRHPVVGSVADDFVLNLVDNKFDKFFESYSQVCFCLLVEEESVEGRLDDEL